MNSLLPYTDEHEIFRTSFAEFLDRECVPYYGDWLKQGYVDKEFYKKMGDNGFLCIGIDPEYGGLGGDLLYTIIQTEEMNKRGLNCVYTRLHSDVVAPYLERLGSEEIKKEYLPKCASGEKILAVAMSEPEAGSDLAAIATTATKDGDYYILNGSKAFISNGLIADTIVVAARTSTEDKPHKGISLILLDGDTPGFTRSRLNKVGLHGQDTSQLFFCNCKVPKSHLLGEEGKGFYHLMDKLQQERLVAAVNAATMAQYSLDLTLAYVKERQMYGKRLSDFQNTQFTLAKLATEIELARSYNESLALEHIKGKKLTKEVSMAKYYSCDLAARTANACVQFFGGYGLCEDQPIALQFVDSRFMPILAGSAEVQLLIVSRELGL
ncbi:acyl-CoA dehydrogenase [Actinomycetota bacterium]|nr:acyl-CoA dehydrogenase [Actinomycetota bacterium]